MEKLYKNYMKMGTNLMTKWEKSSRIMNNLMMMVTNNGKMIVNEFSYFSKIIIKF